MRFRWLPLLFAIANAHAVILYRSGDPQENLTAPTGPDANSGWQYEGTWGAFLGTPFAPHFFISAAHIGDAGGSFFSFEDVTYHATQSFYDPQSDLVIWKIDGEFPSFAPLYSRTDEVGRPVIEIGRGTQRGDPVTLRDPVTMNDVFKGWYWGPSDSKMRWGENIVSSIYDNGPGFDLLRSEFDANGLFNECHLSVGDSGGAAFMQDGSAWKLVGINYAVDGAFSTSASGTDSFQAALVDRSGFYQEASPMYEAVTGPSAFYPTRISTKLPWIAITIAEAQLSLETDYAALTHTELVVPTTDLVYDVQQSFDLASWQSGTPTNEVLSTNASTQTVKSMVALGSAPRMFLRLAAQRP